MTTTSLLWNLAVAHLLVFWPLFVCVLVYRFIEKARLDKKAGQRPENLGLIVQFGVVAELGLLEDSRGWPGRVSVSA